MNKVGADATVDYSKDITDLVSEIQRITNNTLHLAFDAVAQNNSALTALYDSLPATQSPRVYVTTNDWDPLPGESLGFTSVGIELGPIGRPESTKLNGRVEKYIPVAYELLGSGKLLVGEYIVEGEGIEGIPGAWDYLKSGKAGSKKVVVKVADA
jgi:threonine dehydrogenase-like Zn-dependent dehydrogenase